MKFFKIFCIVLFLIITIQSEAKVRLPSLFSDNMVLQQKNDVNIWGWSDAGQEIIISPSWNGKTYTATANIDGEWKILLPTPEAGGPYEISISDEQEIILKNVLIGEVWLCAGQSNMEMPMKGFMGQPVLGSNDDILRSSNPNIRFISVPRSCKTIPQDDFEGQWLKAEPKTVTNFSATAYYFGRLLNEILDIPVGMVEVSYGGSCVEAWMSKETSGPFEEADIPGPTDSIGIFNRTPTALFNGMLSPVIGFGIKGAIWYQGETNHINPDEYLERFPAMVKEWRSLWQIGDFPFYYAQIAPFDYSGNKTKEEHLEKYNSAYLRESQLKALDEIPNSGMAVLLDAGLEDNIHPDNKEVAGSRLAYIALGKTYGIEGIGYTSPTLRAIEIVGSIVIVSFNNVPNGITSFNKEITLFEIAGEDREFYPAQVILRRKSVVLSSPDVANPVAVRYAFKDYVEGELFSTEGLPVPSFRTDDW
jgi:sialate O-acetylesterase